MAATVLVPAVLGLGAWASQVEMDQDALEAAPVARYALGCAGALAGQALLVAALVAQARRGRPARPGAKAGTVALGWGIAVLVVSALYLLLPALAVLPFLLSLFAGVPIAALALVLLLVAAASLVRARPAGREPADLAVGCASAAGWLVAVVVMPLAGGLFVLGVSGA